LSIFAKKQRFKEKNAQHPPNVGWRVLDLVGTVFTVAVTNTTTFPRESLRATFGWLFFVQPALCEEAPLEMLQNPGMLTTSPNSHVPSKRPLRVLVAEDHIINQSLCHTGVVVSDGQKALRCLAQLPFDLVLMDVMMPNMDGMAALSAIRELEARGRAHLPVIMATSHDLPGDRERFIEMGADGYVAKPIHIDQLGAEIKRLIRF
jgi:CheY-like chemotaxis protein